jgi:hypothetical protein
MDHSAKIEAGRIVVTEEKSIQGALKPFLLHIKYNDPSLLSVWQVESICHLLPVVQEHINERHFEFAGLRRRQPILNQYVDSFKHPSAIRGWFLKKIVPDN